MATKKITYNGLGFPVVLIGFKMKKIHGQSVPAVNFKELQAKAFEALTFKQGRLTGAELAFVRAYLGLTQVEFARKVGLSNHSRVSQWEKRSLKVTGMEFLTELSVRLLMAAAIKEGLIAKVYKELSANKLKDEDNPVELSAA